VTLQSVTFDTFVIWTCAVCCFCFIVLVSFQLLPYTWWIKLNQ